MATRQLAALLLVFAAAGCANSVSTSQPGAASVPSSVGVTASLPADAPTPRASNADETISGIVTAGVERNCLLLQDANGAHLLVFHDPSMRAEAKPGRHVVLTGRSEPTMMSTCQQGVPFVVASVQAG